LEDRVEAFYDAVTDVLPGLVDYTLPMMTDRLGGLDHWLKARVGGPPVKLFQYLLKQPLVVGGVYVLEGLLDLICPHLFEVQISKADIFQTFLLTISQVFCI
jgi:hypothetical protein